MINLTIYTSLIISIITQIVTGIIEIIALFIKVPSKQFFLKETTIIGPMAAHLIASGEKSGQLSAMMERAAQHLDNEVKRLIDTALSLLEPLVILFMGGVVLFIVLATLLPIFSMEQLVT